MATHTAHALAKAPPLEELQRRAARARDEALAATAECRNGLAALRRTMRLSQALHEAAAVQAGPSGPQPLAWRRSPPGQ